MVASDLCKTENIGRFLCPPPVVPHALVMVKKYRSKLLNLFFYHYLRGSVLKIFGLEHFQTVMIMVVLGNGWGVV